MKIILTYMKNCVKIWKEKHTHLLIHTYTYTYKKGGWIMSEIQAISENTEIKIYQSIDTDLFNRFIAYLDSTEKTIQTYTRALRQLFNYLSINGITKPTREDIIAFRDDLKSSGHKPTTVQNYITATKLFFKWTSQERLYPNVAEHIKGAKLNREHKKDYLTSRQVKSILDAIKKDNLKGLRDYAMLTLMITGGLRTIEVVRADISDLRNIGECTVLFVQGKGREEKTEYIKITPEVERALRLYLTERGSKTEKEPLFTSTSNNNAGQRVTTRTISKIVKERLKSAGYDSNRLTAHSLRHTAVTLSLLAGKDITEVQQFARHTNITTTMIYNHSLDKTKNSCGEAISKAIF